MVRGRLQGGKVKNNSIVRGRLQERRVKESCNDKEVWSIELVLKELKMTPL